MGRRGPKPTPTIVLRERGSWRAHARGERVIPTEIPKPPDWLHGRALDQWHYLSRLLFDQGLLTDLDVGMLAILCESWSDYWDVCDIVEEEGRTVSTGTGSRKAHPCVAMRDTFWRQICQVSRLFFLDPMDAGAKAAPKPPEEATKSRFFKGPGGTKPSA